MTLAFARLKNAKKKKTHVLRAKRIVTVTECTLQFFKKKSKEKHEKGVQTSRTFLKVSSSYITPCRVQKKLNISFCDN